MVVCLLFNAQGQLLWFMKSLGLRVQDTLLGASPPIFFLGYEVIYDVTQWLLSDDGC